MRKKLKKLCEICKINPATVPDRNKMPGRLINRLCSQCHSTLIKSDIKNILIRLADVSMVIGCEPDPFPTEYPISTSFEVRKK